MRQYKVHTLCCLGCSTFHVLIYTSFTELYNATFVFVHRACTANDHSAAPCRNERRIATGMILASSGEINIWIITFCSFY